MPNELHLRRALEAAVTEVMLLRDATGGDLKEHYQAVYQKVTEALNTLRGPIGGKPTA